MDPKYTFEQIEAYLDGELPPQEASAFEAALDSDTDLQQAVAAHRATRRAVDAYATQRTHERVKSIFTEHQKKKQPGFSTNMLRIAAAIAVVLALGISYFYVQGGTDAIQLAEAYLEPYPDRITTMGSEADSPIMAAINAYNKADYVSALEAFRQVPSDHPQQALVQLYTGISALETGAEGEAIQVLKPLAEQAGDYQGAAQWYLALAYLKQDDAKAIPLLRKLAENGGYRATSAQEILEELE